MTASLLVAGTTSDAGKSVLTTGLCRAFARRGLKVAPFKAQNMSNNSMVCADGGEIGRAQWIQARAAGAEPETAMNPVLLKPAADRRSHVVLMGRPAGEISSSEFVGGRSGLAAAAHAAYDDLLGRFDLVVCEGAGSPTEINLRADDYVNMGLAQHGDIPTIVVGDIDRGGVFAALFGTVALLSLADQRLVGGFVINKFRGDESLLKPGLDQIEELTGRRVFGVLPWQPGLWLDSEDALDLDGRRSRDRDHVLKVAVVRFPRISNFTDIDALGVEPDVDVVFAGTARELLGADLIVLPGTRSTIADLAWLRSRGMDRVVMDHVAAGRPVLGVCGGFQMLGLVVSDPQCVEGSVATVVEGLGLLEVSTTFSPHKTVRLVSGMALGVPVSGYEIHHGAVSPTGSEAVLVGTRAPNVFGTMWHGCLEGDAFRQVFLTEAARLVGMVREPSPVRFDELREARLDLLGDLVEQHLDLDALVELTITGVQGVPFIPPGA